jgi:hypothetical protein
MDGSKKVAALMGASLDGNQNSDRSGRGEGLEPKRLLLCRTLSLTYGSI